MFKSLTLMRLLTKYVLMEYVVAVMYSVQAKLVGEQTTPNTLLPLITLFQGSYILPVTILTVEKYFTPVQLYGAHCA